MQSLDESWPALAPLVSSAFPAGQVLQPEEPSEVEYCPEGHSRQLSTESCPGAMASLGRYLASEEHKGTVS